eukprot:TRINITY_DN6726_c0_g1_i1.p1 TRINITY_DN6726_c0_g1~~TRINITY_DN6726_c0_g1_i1.p1  ORF type:complete len:423 (+),score=87.29 TRINITY_DN6726_c0_g1_i1:61-1329(+)
MGHPAQVFLTTNAFVAIYSLLCRGEKRNYSLLTRLFQVLHLFLVTNLMLMFGFSELFEKHNISLSIVFKHSYLIIIGCLMLTLLVSLIKLSQENVESGSTVTNPTRTWCESLTFILKILFVSVAMILTIFMCYVLGRSFLAQSNLIIFQNGGLKHELLHFLKLASVVVIFLCGFNELATSLITKPLSELTKSFEPKPILGQNRNASKPSGTTFLSGVADWLINIIKVISGAILFSFVTLFVCSIFTDMSEWKNAIQSFVISGVYSRTKDFFQGIDHQNILTTGDVHEASIFTLKLLAIFCIMKIARMNTSKDEQNESESSALFRRFKEVCMLIVAIHVVCLIFGGAILSIQPDITCNWNILEFETPSSSCNFNSLGNYLELSLSRYDIKVFHIALISFAFFTLVSKCIIGMIRKEETVQARS